MRLVFRSNCFRRQNASRLLASRQLPKRQINRMCLEKGRLAVYDSRDGRTREVVRREWFSSRHENDVMPRYAQRFCSVLSLTQHVKCQTDGHVWWSQIQVLTVFFLFCFTWHHAQILSPFFWWNRSSFEFLSALNSGIHKAIVQLETCIRHLKSTNFLLWRHETSIAGRESQCQTAEGDWENVDS